MPNRGVLSGGQRGGAGRGGKDRSSRSGGAKCERALGQAALESTSANLAQSTAKLNQASDNFKRGQELFKDNLLSQQDFDTRLSDFRVAQTGKDFSEAQVVEAKAQYQQALYNRDSTRAKVAQSQALLLASKNQLAQTVYNSPLDGYITSLPVHLGENVVPGIQNAVGSLLYQVS